MNKVSLLTAALTSALFGCSGAADMAMEGPPPSYHQEAATILSTYCTSCHQQGGIGPLSLTDYASARAAGPIIRGAVASGEMPPWLPSQNGVDLRYSRALRPADRDVLLKWIDSGMAEGDPAQPSRLSVPPLEQVVAPRPDLTLDPGFEYVPKMGPTDDYHCFPIGEPFAADTYIAAGDIIPGNKAIVHHVIVYEVMAKDVAAMRQKDSAEAGPGYTCYGGPGVGSPQTLLVWAPGSVPMRAPEGTTMRVSKGSVLVSQVHYNLAQFAGKGDRSVAHMELSKAAPQQVVTLLPIADPGKLKIPAGAKAAQQTIVIPVGAVLNYTKLPNLTLYGNVPHMHTRGTSVVTSNNGEPLVELPRWDFNWQQVYQFRQPVVLGASDLVTVTCTFNNTAENQPVINGMRLPVQDVTWGEDTTDEMCVSFVQIALPVALKIPMNLLSGSLATQ